ncbi:MAG: adenylyltransferase/cytidyltransferase family protein [Elusimicrobia bacterium]|nr:adenylyltransferase/cytidyltransferase family protein [Elusimicrobiota bacterium]
MGKIIFFGGAFDPVHAGHLALLRAARKAVAPGLTLVVPTGNAAVHKQAAAFPADLRLKMLRAALAGFSKTRILDYEIKRCRPPRSAAPFRRSGTFGVPGGRDELRGRRCGQRPLPTYTWQTLRYIKARWPKSVIYLLIGSDNLPLLKTWKRPGLILRDPRVVLVAGHRAMSGEGVRSSFVTSRRQVTNEDLTPSPLPASRCIFVPGEFPPIASSDIREGLIDSKPARRRQARKMIPAAVRPFLEAPAALCALAELYCKKNLPLSRLRHTRAVVRLASELAEIHGLEAKKAGLAAWLHDLSRVKENFSGHRQALRHGPRSAEIARKIFGVEDRDVLEAVSCHTTGRPRQK